MPRSEQLTHRRYSHSWSGWKTCLVGTDWKMNTEALSYSRTKGLFAGVAVDGAKIQQDNDSTVAFYGKNVSFRKTLSGDVHAPASSDSFLAAVKAAERQANRHEAVESK